MMSMHTFLKKVLNVIEETKIKINTLIHTDIMANDLSSSSTVMMMIILEMCSSDVW